MPLLVRLAPLGVLLCFLLPGTGCGDDEAFEAPAPASAAPTPPTSDCAYVPPNCEALDPASPLPAVISSCKKITKSGTYRGTFVNIVNGGALYIDEIADLTVDIRVSSMLVEYGGVLQAGSASCPFGEQRGKLAFSLWGDDPSQEGKIKAPPPGIQCETGKDRPPMERCFAGGAEPMGATFCTGDPNPDSPDTCNKPMPSGLDGVVNGPEGKNFLLEHYDNLNFDGSPFGYKTLSVSYGGSLRLFGHKGTSGAAKVESPDEHCRTPEDTTLTTSEMDAWANLSGSSWTRLTAQDDDDDTTTLTLDRTVSDWEVDDDIVIGPTDWYPGHAEQRTIRRVAENGGKTMLTVERLRYPHQTKMLDLDEYEKAGATFTGTPKRRAADLRAPVGLLSRSIKIRSLGKTDADEFPSVEKCMIDKSDVSDGGKQDPACYFGGHVMFRQGFRDVQIQGAEFKQLGQGGRIGHYPVHFHLAKSTAYTQNRAFVKDSSIWDSMTRFVVLHGTHDVTVARNVGYLSTGHGYYAEDASEINNRFCHNLGVEARAPLAEYLRAQTDPTNWSSYDRKKALAQAGSQNLKAPPTARFIPPILDGIAENAAHATPAYRRTGSDALMPSMFWIMNAYNELVGNAVSGVHGFGSCYWLLGSGLSGPSVADHSFDGMAAANRGGTSQAPLLRFRGNSCSSAALSLPATPDLPPEGLGQNTGYTLVHNPYLFKEDGKTPKAPSELEGLFDRPFVSGSFRPINTTSSQKNCASTIVNGATALGDNQDACVTTLIDRFTTSFNWAEVNFGPVWLRPWWYLVTNSAFTDQLNAGLSFISAGSWEQVPPGYFSLVQDSLFAGTTQFGGSPYAKRSGPILRIKHGTKVDTVLPACAMGSNLTCNVVEEGTGYWTGGFQPKRLLNIYDGPAYAGGNTFINVGSWKCDPQPCAREGKACSDVLPCAEDQKDESSATCDKEYPCGVYAFTRQPHPGQPADPPAAADAHKMIVMDAAIGWKQPNGFYYPPAFAHADETFFKTPPKRPGEAGPTNDLDQCWGPDAAGKLDFQSGDCRHNAIDRTYTYVLGSALNLRGDPNFQRRAETIPNRRLDVSPIDFQTILVDLDGTLTGATATLSTDAGNGKLVSQPTASVSRNTFFDAPLQTDECLSFGVQTSPYQFVTTALGKLKASPTAGNVSAIDSLDANWASHASRNFPFQVIGGSPMVPIYRQWQLAGDTACDSVCDAVKPTTYGCTRASFMMGPDVGQAIQLTLAQPRGMPDFLPNGSGFYYIDTNAQNQSTSCVQKLDADANKVAKFAGGATYVVYDLFARNDTKISYSFYVGDAAGSLDELVPTVVKVDPHRKPADGLPDADSLASFFCDARSTGSCSDYVKFDVASHVLTVTLDHAKIKSAFTGSARTPKEQCLTRDMCHFEGGQCRSCWDASGAKHPDCTKPTPTFAADVKALSTQLKSYCEDWSQLATGTKTDTLGERSLVDCPEGGCLGVAFTLPAGFTPKAYKDVFPDGASPACFQESDWSKNALVPRRNSPNVDDYADPLCGAAKPTASFCQ